MARYPAQGRLGHFQLRLRNPQVVSSRVSVCFEKEVGLAFAPVSYSRLAWAES